MVRLKIREFFLTISNPNAPLKSLERLRKTLQIRYCKIKSLQIFENVSENVPSGNYPKSSIFFVRLFKIILISNFIRIVERHGTIGLFEKSQ
jgi:hypothetical protein